MDTQNRPKSQFKAFRNKVHSIQSITGLDNNHAVYLVSLLSELNQALPLAELNDYPLAEKLKELYKVLELGLAPQ
ncbi:hypothetical protein [Thiofilum flexile]|uniref:hypothetical protein n=1 Tax=Thiofilum flexile TaxID=125627 RepID=UPI00037E2F28|nr:hypothetical protein [Thiofilum flexile]